jgi:histidinol-phosphate aminotransferase
MPWFDSTLRPELAQIRAYHPAHAPADAIRLDANESPWALSRDARAHLAESIAAIDLNRYPDVRATRLRERIAEREGVHPDQIVIGCGSDEVIAIVVSALSRPRAGRARATVMFPEPSFVMFRTSSLLAGCEPVAVPLDTMWDLDADATCAAIAQHEPSVVFVPSPNNPTGNLFSDASIERVVHTTRGRALVLLDEAYGAFSGRTYRNVRSAHEHVGQLQTLSKAGLAGARVGWAVLPSRELAAEIDKVRQPYNLGSVSQCIGEAALGPLEAEISHAVQRVVAERERLTRALAQVPGLAVAPSQANFVWVDVGRDAGAVHQALMARGVVVRSFHAAGGRLSSRLRVTVGSPDENSRLLDALAHVLESTDAAR